MSRRYGADFGFTSYDPAWVAGLNRLVTRLRSTGAAVLVVGPIPDPRTTVPTCLSGHLDDALACSPPPPMPERRGHRGRGANGRGVQCLGTVR